MLYLSFWLTLSSHLSSLCDTVCTAPPHSLWLRYLGMYHKRANACVGTCWSLMLRGKLFLLPASGTPDLQATKEVLLYIIWAPCGLHASGHSLQAARWESQHPVLVAMYLAAVRLPHLFAMELKEWGRPPYKVPWRVLFPCGSAEVSADPSRHARTSNLAANLESPAQHTALCSDIICSSNAPLETSCCIWMSETVA